MATTEPFVAKRGFRQGDSLSCDFFNILMERIICAAGLMCTGIIFYKSVMPLAYADDIESIGSREREVAVAFSKFAKEVRGIGLAVNESKTKYLLSSTAKYSTIWESVEIEGYNFEVVKVLVYLTTAEIPTTTSVWKSDVGLLLLIDVTVG